MLSLPWRRIAHQNIVTRCAQASSTLKCCSTVVALHKNYPAIACCQGQRGHSMRRERLKTHKKSPFPSYHTSPSTSILNNLSGNHTMEAQELLHFLADSPPSCVRLEIAPHFEALSEQEKRYAHYISRHVSQRVYFV